MKTVTVLMYHAVSDVTGQSQGADPHYSVTRTQFRRHLELVSAAGGRAASVASLLAQPDAGNPRVGFTFDDGHASNADAAADLVEHGGSADFFVNPSTVGTPHHLSWAALQDMATVGMSIQSHGQHHRYLDELPEREVEAELADSKHEIEDRIGRPVTLFAPPGGRVAPGLGELAGRLGYQAVCSSRVSLWQRDAGAWDVPRLAVLASTTDVQLRRWVEQRTWELAARQLRYRVLAAAKSALGNGRYERVRRALLGGAGEGGR
ncbi:polysaccharide deacetylase family protein [Schlegelella sp. S2-27]|uniref:Polysaccharide deacetylase family protein n=1 Tax=Caldimonas mangrovi TaxID=2944811 RepID=A0ABT0YR64_9BURK|nr:polysaccharide deacetylase family protein [Caldimonas mangrovi]MCM5680328.1 polysaccharide deacetylase family protein [Caldimonas mangrovi]